MRSFFLCVFCVVFVLSVSLLVLAGPGQGFWADELLRKARAPAAGGFTAERPRATIPV